MKNVKTDRLLPARQVSHQGLDREIAQWRSWWGELAEMGRPSFGEMASRIGCFRELLSKHFAEEENGVFLTLVTQAEPQTVARIAELQDEHRTFLRDIQRLIDRLSDQEQGIECWGAARDEFEEFLDRLNSHEEAEEELSRQTSGHASRSAIES